MTQFSLSVSLVNFSAFVYRIYEFIGKLCTCAFSQIVKLYLYLPQLVITNGDDNARR